MFSFAKFLRLTKVTLLILSITVSPSCYADDFAQRKEVKIFIQQMVKKYQFSPAYLTSIFNTVKVRPMIMANMNKPKEKKPWHIYQLLFVNEWRIQHGVEFWKKNEAVLARAEKEFGVPASIIVATIGVETKYGTRTGSFRVIDSLSNLAFSNSPRALFFRKELEQFLILTREQKLDPLRVMGSYAGAIGQPQFMPSSYRTYAINFSNSGKTDLINNNVDVIGSIANYYKKNGWVFKEPIAEQAYILGDRYGYLSKKNQIPHVFSIVELSKYGVIPKKKINEDYLKVKVIELESRYSKEYWLGFHNFDVIKRYNPSDLYAMAVFQLSYYIQSVRERLNNG